MNEIDITYSNSQNKTNQITDCYQIKGISYNRICSLVEGCADVTYDCKCFSKLTGQEVTCPVFCETKFFTVTCPVPLATTPNLSIYGFEINGTPQFVPSIINANNACTPTFWYFDGVTSTQYDDATCGMVALIDDIISVNVVGNTLEITTNLNVNSLSIIFEFPPPIGLTTIPAVFEKYDSQNCELYNSCNDSLETKCKKLVITEELIAAGALTGANGTIYQYPLPTIYEKICRSCGDKTSLPTFEYYDALYDFKYKEITEWGTFINTYLYTPLSLPGLDYGTILTNLINCEDADCKKEIFATHDRFYNLPGNGETLWTLPSQVDPITTITDYPTAIHIGVFDTDLNKPQFYTGASWGDIVTP